MNTVTNDDTDALIKKYKQVRKKQIERLKDTDDINEGFEPQDIDFIERPWGDEPIDSVLNHIDNNSELLKQYSEAFSLKTPSWLDVWFAIKKEKGNEQLLTKYRVDQSKLSHMFLQINKLVSYPNLLLGAIYQKEKGSWRLFKNNEVITYVESELTKIFDGWDVYDNQTVVLTRKYIIRLMYQGKDSKDPFMKSSPYLVAFKNGTFNMKTGALEENSPENYILDGHDYELDTSNAETPQTDSWFKELFGENAEFMTQYVGYLFYRSYDYSQIILILQSEGGRGKSKWLNYIKNLVGFGNHSSMSLKQLTSDSEFNSSALYQKDLNYFADIGSDFIRSTETIKALSGDDTTAAQFKGSNSFDFHNHAKLLFSANKLPTTKVDDTGLRRRIKIVPIVSPVVDNAFKQRHPMKKINQERSAFVYKAIKAFMWAMKNIDGKNFGATRSILNATNKWIDDNDTVKNWLIESVEDGNVWAGGFTRGIEAYKSYNDWSLGNGYKSKGRNLLFKELQRLGLIQDRRTFNGKQQRCWILPEQYLDK
ncbi:DNA primase family protein [Lentilactobacillus kefiri]|uniref:DNA primase family protein n=1 Tax=Lentilactobacillus kefiri TaxID=33962 RepID=UPI0021C4C656|nr:DNA primase family protein [Lentilactobacillus kefiri]MCP9370027.1 hypothetical protein [Lentilactobacillus kefiri]